MSRSLPWAGQPATCVARCPLGRDQRVALACASPPPTPPPIHATLHEVRSNERSSRPACMSDRPLSSSGRRKSRHRQVTFLPHELSRMKSKQMHRSNGNVQCLFLSPASCCHVQRADTKAGLDILNWYANPSPSANRFRKMPTVRRDAPTPAARPPAATSIGET